MLQVQQAVADALVELLQLEHVDMEDELLSLGLTSLHAVRLSGPPLSLSLSLTPILAYRNPHKPYLCL